MARKNDKEFQDMKPLFLDEFAQNLEALESQIQTLENDTNDQSALTEIYRLLHTYKGTSATMGYGELEQFFHNFESVISLAIEKKVLITTDFMNLLYKSIDLIEQALNILKNEQPIGSLFDTFIREMNGFRPVDLEASGDTNKKERLKEFFKEYGLEDFAQGNITYLDPSKKFYFITITIEKNIRK